MPKLSRTAKYADLRNQLLNDKEELTNSKELSSYQDRLNNVENTLHPNRERDMQEFYNNGPITDDPIFQELIQKEAGFDFSFKPVEKPVVEQAPVVEEIKETPVVEQTPVVEEIKETPVVEQPVQVEQAPAVEEIVEAPVIEEAIIEEVNDDQVEQVVEEAEPVSEDINLSENISVFGEQPQVEQTPVEEVSKESSFFDSFMNETPVDNGVGNNFNSYFETSEANEVSLDNMFKDVEDESGEIVSLKERETYLNQTLSDVNLYNKEIGEETINTAVDNLIDEIRHPEARYDEVVEEVEEQEEYLDADIIEPSTPEEDEEFTSTLSTEITKIMDEVAEVNNIRKFEEVEINEPVVSQEDKTIQINAVPEERADEKVVEIKNIAEIENEEVNTMSQTIPFVVAADDEDIIDDEDEEDGSNVVLNIILIVLIIVLVAVLGLIVFYILKTKGIL